MAKTELLECSYLSGERSGQVSRPAPVCLLGDLTLID